MPSAHGFQTPDDRQRTHRLLLADYDRIDPAVRAVLAEFASASALDGAAVRGSREELTWGLGDADAGAALAVVVRLVLAGVDWTPWLAVAVTEAAAGDPENVLTLPGALRRATTLPARLADAPHGVWHHEERRHWGVH
jgi:hypothetical protein